MGIYHQRVLLLSVLCGLLIHNVNGQVGKAYLQGWNVAMNFDLESEEPNSPETQQYLAIDNLDLTQLTGPFTMEFWYTWTRQSAQQSWLAFVQDAQNYLTIGPDAGCGGVCLGVVFSYEGVEQRATSTSMSLLTEGSLWTHISFAYRAPPATSEIRFLRPLQNSAPSENTFTFTLPLNFTKILTTKGIGFVSSPRPTTVATGYIGKFDELRIWNYFRSLALTKSEYTTILTGSETDLVAYFSLDNPQHGVFSDITGSGAVARIIASAVGTVANMSLLAHDYRQGTESLMGTMIPLHKINKVVNYNEIASMQVVGTVDTVTVVPLSSTFYGGKICDSASPSCNPTNSSNNMVYVHLFRGACGTTQTPQVSLINNGNSLGQVTMNLEVLPLQPVLTVQNYSLPTVGGTINIEGSNFGLDGPLDFTEQAYVQWGANTVNCSSAQVTTGGTRITCGIASGVGHGATVHIRSCNRVASYVPTFSFEPPVIYSAAVTASSNNDTIIVITGNNFGAEHFLSNPANVISINGTICNVISVNHTAITCLTPRVLVNELTYPVSMTIGGQSTHFEFNYTLCTPACENGGRCVARNLCDCTSTPYQGDYCEDPLVCLPPCKNGGTCYRSSADLTSLVCECVGDWDGQDCGQSTIISQESADLGLIIGLSAGGGGAVLILVIALIVVWIKRPAPRGGKTFIPLEKKDFTKIIFGDQLNQTPEKDTGNLDELEKFLLEDDLKLAFAVSDITQITEADKIAKALIIIFQDSTKVLSLLQAFIDEEVKTTESAGTLFRSNSMVSKMFKFYSRLIGLPYLYTTVGPELNELIEAELGLEVDPEKMEEGTDLDEMRWMLMAQSQKILKQILNSSETCPVQFRSLFAHIKYIVNQRFPENVNTTIGGFIFLRFFCPAISSPEAYGIFEEPPSPNSRRLLILITKVLQNLSNDVEFGSKEPYMAKMNDFIQSNRTKLAEFYDKLVKPTNKDGTDAALPANIKKVSLAVISSHIKNTIDQFTDPAMKKRLEGIVN